MSINFPDLICLKIVAQKQQAPVSMRDGISMAKKIKAVQYFECSAKTFQGVELLRLP